MSDYMKEAERLVSELIDAAHGTVLNEDQSREDETRAALLAHIQRGAVPVEVPMPEPVGWYVSGSDPEHAALWLDRPDDEQMRVMNQQCDDGPVVARPLALGEDAKRYGDAREAAGYARGLQLVAEVRAELAAPAAVPMPEPDTHCYDEDERRNVWSYSRDLLLHHGDAREAAGYARGYRDGQLAAQAGHCSASCTQGRCNAGVTGAEPQAERPR